MLYSLLICAYLSRFFCLRVLTLPVHLWLLSFFTVLVTESNHLYFCMSSMWLLLLYSHSSYCLQFIAFEWLSIKLIQVIRNWMLALCGCLFLTVNRGHWLFLFMSVHCHWNILNSCVLCACPLLSKHFIILVSGRGVLSFQFSIISAQTLSF